MVKTNLQEIENKKLNSLGVLEIILQKGTLSDSPY